MTKSAMKIYSSSLQLLIGTAALVAVTLTTSHAQAQARPSQADIDKPACDDNKTVNCVGDGVFVLEGTPDLYAKSCIKRSQYQDGVFGWDCFYDYDKVVTKFLAQLKAAGVNPPKEQWDQVAVFGIDSNEASRQGGQ